MKKDSYDFPGKRAYRRAWREFVHSFLSGSSPKETTVACFPGHECLEITEVYDSLGIPRENITCLERDRATAREINRTLKGAHLVQQNAKDFFETTDKKFTIINLDYQGQLASDERDTIASICERQLLGRRGILGTNFYASREHSGRQAEYQNYANFHRNGLMTLQQTMQLFGSKVNYALIDETQGLKAVRSDGISQALLSTIASQRPGFFYKQALETMLKLRPMMLQQIYRDIDPTDPQQLKNASHDAPIMSVLAPLYLKAMRQLPELSKLHDTSLMQILNYCITECEKPYLVENHKRYSYRTDANRAPLFCDFFCVNRHWYRWENDYLTFTVEGDDVKAYQRAKPIEQLLKTVNKFIVGPVRAYLPEFTPKRVPLDQTVEMEARPSKDQLTKADAIQLLESGCNPVEIVEVYKGFSISQLRALKAHVTMGTYRPNIQVQN